MLGCAEERFIIVAVDITRASVYVSKSFSNNSTCEVSKKVKQARNRPGVSQRVPEGLGSQISIKFGT